MSGSHAPFPVIIFPFQNSRKPGKSIPIEVLHPLQWLVEKIENSQTKLIRYSGKWSHAASDSLSVSSSDQKDAFFSIKFRGGPDRHVWTGWPKGWLCADNACQQQRGIVLSAILDNYSMYSTSTLQFISPVLGKDNYTLIVKVMGERSNWSDKRKSDYGSTGYFVSLDKIIIRK